MSYSDSCYKLLNPDFNRSPQPQQASSTEQAQLTSSSLARWLSESEPRVVILGAQPPVADEQAEPPKPQGK